jgi:hypothetical protein
MARGFKFPGLGVTTKGQDSAALRTKYKQLGGGFMHLKWSYLTTKLWTDFMLS